MPFEDILNHLLIYIGTCAVCGVRAVNEFMEIKEPNMILLPFVWYEFSFQALCIRVIFHYISVETTTIQCARAALVRLMSVATSVTEVSKKTIRIE